jgi:hypothetical protein
MEDTSLKSKRKKSREQPKQKWKKRENVTKRVGFEALTPVVMKSTVCELACEPDHHVSMGNLSSDSERKFYIRTLGAQPALIFGTSAWNTSP